MMHEWNLPPEWEWIPLAELCDLYGGSTPRRSNESYFGGDIVWVTPSDLESDGMVETVVNSKTKLTAEGLDSCSARRLPVGTVLFSSRATVGKVAIAGVPLATNQGFANFVCNVRLDNRYLAWVLRALTEPIKQLATSTTYLEVSKRALRPFTIPLPYPYNPSLSLAEQRRIVARIEELFDELREAKNLYEQALEDIERLYRSIIFVHDGWSAEYIALNKLVDLKPASIPVEDEVLYRFAGIRSFGRGIFESKEKYGHEFSYRKLVPLSKGNFTYPKLMAWEGALGAVTEEFDGYVVSPEFVVFEVNEELVLPETLDVYFRTPSIWPMLADRSTGTNARRRRLYPDAFLSLEFPLPPMNVQLQLREAKRELDSVLKAEEKTMEELYKLEQAILAQAFRGEL